jgi:dUTP pyrophosphatase
MAYKIYCVDEELKPKVGSKFAAGIDLKTASDFSLEPGQEITIGTGVYVEIPRYMVGLIGPRSSLGSHDGLYVALKNTLGFIDSDYRGEIGVKLINKGTKTLTMFRGDRVCQMVVVPHHPANPIFVNSKDELSDTERGSGGWGHSGDDIKTQ